MTSNIRYVIYIYTYVRTRLYTYGYYFQTFFCYFRFFVTFGFYLFGPTAFVVFVYANYIRVFSHFDVYVYRIFLRQSVQLFGISFPCYKQYPTYIRKYKLRISRDLLTSTHHPPSAEVSDDFPTAFPAVIRIVYVKIRAFVRRFFD